jgi:hypothetical protein
MSLSIVFTYAQAKSIESKMVCTFVLPFVFLTIKTLVANKNSNFKLLFLGVNHY